MLTEATDGEIGQVSHPQNGGCPFINGIAIRDNEYIAISQGFKAHRGTDPLCAKVRKNLQIMLFLHIISRRLSKK